MTFQLIEIIAIIMEVDKVSKIRAFLRNSFLHIIFSVLKFNLHERQHYKLEQFI